MLDASTDDFAGGEPGPPVCPNCGRILSAAPVTVLCPGDAALEDLFRGTLNVVRCPDCDTRVALGVPVVFRDDERRVLIYYLPLKDPSGWREAEDTIQKITESVFGPESEGEPPDVRLVITRRTFIEKIALHQRGLDDRIVEYLKYQLYSRKDDRVDSETTEILYDFTASDDEKLAFLLFDRKTGEPKAAAHFPMSVYEELAELFASDSDVAADLDRIFPGCYVSVERLLRG